MKAILEVIGAVVVTTIILWVPVLSFLSFIYDWDGFIIMSLFLGSTVDFLFVLSKLLGETE